MIPHSSRERLRWYTSFTTIELGHFGRNISITLPYLFQEALNPGASSHFTSTFGFFGLRANGPRDRFFKLGRAYCSSHGRSVRKRSAPWLSVNLVGARVWPERLLPDSRQFWALDLEGLLCVARTSGCRVAVADASTSSCMTSNVRRLFPPPVGRCRRRSSASAPSRRSGHAPSPDRLLVALRGASVCAGFEAKFDSAWGLDAEIDGWSLIVRCLTYADKVCLRRLAGVRPAKAALDAAVGGNKCC
jgi:hypothetical protein